jgi:peroxiredoxin
MLTHGGRGDGMPGKSPNEVLAAALQECFEIDVSLSERLERFAAISRSLNPSHAKQVDALIARLRQSGVGDSSPQPGDPMPAFVMPDQDGQLVSLEDILRGGPAALIFHRGHWCPYCRINTRTLAQAYHQIRDLGGQVVAIAPDRQQFTKQLSEELALPFPVLSDVDNGYSLSLNLAVWLDDELRSFFASRGHDLPRFQGNDSWMVPVPATFIVDTGGIIRERFIDPDYRKGFDLDVLLRAFRNTPGVLRS